MDRKAAKELLDIRGWLERVEGVVERGKWALAVANRNFLIHQYDEINRELTWLTLSRDLPAWRSSLRTLFAGARTTVEEEAD